MKYLLTSLLFIWLGDSLFGQGIEELLEKHYEASGLNRMQKVETIITEGRNIYSMAGVETLFTTFQQRPNKIRIQGNYQGSEVIQTYNGRSGWMLAPAMGIPEPREIRGEELKVLLNQNKFESPLWNTEEKGYTLELLEPSKDGSSFLLKMVSEEKDENVFVISRESYLITAIRSSQVIGGSQKEIEVVMSDYRSVRGIPTAHRVVTRMDGEAVTTLVVDKVEYNKKIDPLLFEKPATDPD